MISFASIISTNLSVKFPRSSFNPLFVPANEKAWQGVPPQIKSGAWIDSFKIREGMLFISPMFGMCGYFSFNNWDGKFAISENQLNSNPSGFHATEAASIPEQTLPTVLISISNHL